MLALPFELQLLIIENLDAIDVFTLQLTCKSLYRLIEESGKAVWRNCLERHCGRNGLFKPSFQHLVSQDAFKQAASASRRFARAYRRAANAVDSREIGQRRARLEFPVSELPEVEGNINELYLIPGGRFLITFNDLSLLMWDLSKAPTPDLVFKRPIERHESVAYTNLLDGEKVHLIYEVEADWPEDYTPNTPDDGPWDNITVSEFVELYIPQDDSKFHCRDLGRFTLIHPEVISADAFSVVDDKVVMLIDGVTVAWNYVHNTYAAWKLGGDASKPVEVLTNPEYVMYISSEGIHGVRFPNFEPISKGYVVFSSITTTIPPAFSVLHDTAYDLTHSDLLPIQVFGPDISTSVDKDHPFIYDVRQAVAKTKAEGSGDAPQSDSKKDKLDLLPAHVAQMVREYKASGGQLPEQDAAGPLTEADQRENEFMHRHLTQLATGDFSVSVLPDPKPDMEVHRHRFSFNPSDPTKSTLELVSSQKAIVRSRPDNPGEILYSNYYEPCDGQTVTLWREGMWDERDDINRKGALLLSMSDIPTGPVQSGKAPSSDVGELPMVPLIDMHADNLVGDDHPWVADCLVDPASGKAVVLWVDDTSAARVELIEIE